TDRADGSQGGGKVDGAFARHQVVMDTRGGDVLQVEMADVRRQSRHGGGRVVADAIEMPDVKIQAHSRRVDVPHQLQKLIGLLDEQTRLRLNEQLHALLFRMGYDRLEHLDEEP